MGNDLNEFLQSILFFSDFYKKSIINLYFYTVNISRLSQIIPNILKKDLKFIDSIIDDHLSGVFQLCTPRSRFINGTTLLHIVATSGNYELLEKVLSLVDRQ